MLGNLSSRAVYATRGIRDRQLMLQLLLPLLLLLLMGWSCSVSGNADDISSTQQLKQGSHKLCGQALNIAMDKVCKNGFNSIHKRRSDVIDSETELTEQTHPGFQLSPLLSSIYGMEVLIKTRRMRRQMTGGIHDECCVRSCDYYELRAYCRQK